MRTKYSVEGDNFVTIMKAKKDARENRRLVIFLVISAAILLYLAFRFAEPGMGSLNFGG